MTNFEKYMKQIRRITDLSNVVALRNGEPEVCDGMPCVECGFSNSFGDCDVARMEWFLAEYEEPRKITEREYHFCKTLDSGYIARDATGCLGWYRTEPVLVGGGFHQKQPGERLEAEIFTVFGVWFDCINNGECFAVRDILKWDVIPEAVVEE